MNKIDVDYSGYDSDSVLFQELYSLFDFTLTAFYEGYYQ